MLFFKSYESSFVRLLILRALLMVCGWFCGAKGEIILQEIAKIENVINKNEDLISIIDLLSSITQNLLGFRCER